MELFERDCEYIRALINRPTSDTCTTSTSEKRGSDDCPASQAFASVCYSLHAKLSSDASLLDFNLTYVLLLHEFWQQYEEVTPEHQPCILAVFALWYKVIR